MRRRSRSQGMFLGNPDPPQDGTGALVDELEFQLTDEPGIRPGWTTSRSIRTLAAGTPPVQNFVRFTGNPNSDEQLDAVPIAINSRRALSRFRGLPTELGG